jgi:hypothetical protein
MTAIHILLFALLPYSLPVIATVAIAWAFWKKRQLDPWLLSLLWLPLASWLFVTWATSRATSLANLNLEPRLLGLVVAAAFLPQLIVSGSEAASEKTRFVIALGCCVLLAVWLATVFPELAE